MRLIDADALKAYIDAQKGRPFIGCTVGEALKIMTDEQPTVTPEPHWIPCEERLPEDERNILITYYGDITMGWYRESVNTWMIYEGEGNAEPDEVTAWMPLPEPYKEVTE